MANPGRPQTAAQLGGRGAAGPTWRWGRLRAAAAAPGSGWSSPSPGPQPGAWPPPPRRPPGPRTHLVKAAPAQICRGMASVIEGTPADAARSTGDALRKLLRGHRRSQGALPGISVLHSLAKLTFQPPRLRIHDHSFPQTTGRSTSLKSAHSRSK